MFESLFRRKNTGPTPWVSYVCVCARGGTNDCWVVWGYLWVHTGSWPPKDSQSPVRGTGDWLSLGGFLYVFPEIVKNYFFTKFTNFTPLEMLQVQKNLIFFAFSNVKKKMKVSWSCNFSGTNGPNFWDFCIHLNFRTPSTIPIQTTIQCCS